MTVDLLVGRSGIEPLTLDYTAIAKARVEVEFSAPSARVLALLGAETAQKFDQETPSDLGEADGSDLDEDENDHDEDDEADDDEDEGPGTP